MAEWDAVTWPVAIHVHFVQGVAKAPTEQISRGVVPFVIVYQAAIGSIAVFS